MTEKLYYADAYLTSFAAKVTSCYPKGERWAVTLDRTAFYPEGGGQPWDTGMLGDAKVLEVFDRGEEVEHILDKPLLEGGQVQGQVDWKRRFDFMQGHTGEHILSGMIHRLYKLDNVGFHMGHDAISIDVNGELTPEQIRTAEDLTNEIIYKNLPVEVLYPTAEELETLEYRSKKELSGQVRIIRIPDGDVCACCGLHVKTTGEAGLVKVLTFQRYKGGMRIFLLCGRQAMKDYCQKNDDIYAIGELLCAKAGETTDAVRRMLEENNRLKHTLAGVQNQLLDLKAQQVIQGARNILRFEQGLAPDAIRRYCLLLSEKCDGVAAVFCGSDRDGYKYALAGKETDVRPLGGKLNKAFGGRGGGSPLLVQGSLIGEKEKIQAFFVNVMEE